MRHQARRHRNPLPGRPVPALDGLRGRLRSGRQGPAPETVVTQVDQASVAEVAAKLTSAPSKEPACPTTCHGNGADRAAACCAEAVRAGAGLVLVVQAASGVATASEAAAIGTRRRANMRNIQHPFRRKRDAPRGCGVAASREPGSGEHLVAVAPSGMAAVGSGSHISPSCSLGM